MSEKILFVDDEPKVLEGYRRILGRDFQIDTAIGGALGLAAIAEQGPYAVVISDMRMPEMDGAQFLARVRDIASATVRIALTGQVDIETAMHAVNKGNIFRFLTKPCSREDLLQAIEAGLVQFRLVNAEKELLEQTLRGAIYVLSEVLGFSNPAAFGRAMRLRRFVQHVAKELKLMSSWHFEIAAMLSQLGCVTLPLELVNAAYAGEPLTPEEQKKYESHSSVAGNMLSHIPRMESIALMIAGQNNSNLEIKAESIEEKSEIEFGIQLLRAGLAFEKLLGRGLNPTDAAKGVRATVKGIENSILESMDSLGPSSQLTMRECNVSDLALGMILQQDLRNSNGMLIVARGQELTFQWIERLKAFWNRGEIGRKVSVSIPV